MSVYDKISIPVAIEETNARFLQRLSNGHYDFIDLGTCDGGGFKIAERQGGRCGLGFDLEPRFVQQAITRGLDVACMDIRALRAHAPMVDFAVCSHILEHLPSLYDVGSVLSAMRRVCRDYLLISGPCFEDEEYLYSKNLKVLHSAMTDHLCKFKVVDLVEMLHRLGLRDYVVALSEPILDSDNMWIHRADEPAEGMWTWNESKNLPKPKISFDRKLYRDFVCVIKLRESIDLDDVLNKFFWGYDKVVFRSSWDFA